MGKVTAVKAQKHNPSRVAVYLDGEYAFGLARIVAAWLKVGQELSPEKIAALQAQDESETAYQQALHYLSYRPRSEAEIIKKLNEKGTDPTVVAAVLERLRSAGLAGDAEFASYWIENRSSFRPRSRRMLAYELHQKGVNEEHIQTALVEVVNEPELAYQAGIRYARRLVDLDWEVFRKRLSGFLSRRGFSFSVVSPVVRQIWDEIHPVKN